MYVIGSISDQKSLSHTQTLSQITMKSHRVFSLRCVPVIRPSEKTWTSDPLRQKHLQPCRPPPSRTIDSCCPELPYVQSQVDVCSLPRHSSVPSLLSTLLDPLLPSVHGSLASSLFGHLIARLLVYNTPSSAIITYADSPMPISYAQAALPKTSCDQRGPDQVVGGRGGVENLKGRRKRERMIYQLLPSSCTPCPLHLLPRPSSWASCCESGSYRLRSEKKKSQRLGSNAVYRS